MAIYALGDFVPSISETAFVHPDAVVIGDVEIGDESSIWPGAVLRGDYGQIRIGAHTSIQDGTIVHCTKTEATIVNDRCTVGHNVHLEGCIVDDWSLIGSSSVVLNGAHVEHHAIVAAGAVVLRKSLVRARTIVAGVPAKERGPVPDGFDEERERGTNRYVANAKRYKAELRRVD